MIFCTIGTQAPFDRFVKIIDEVAAHLDEEIIAQVYKSEYVAQNIRTVEFLPPDEFNKLFSKARPCRYGYYYFRHAPTQAYYYLSTHSRMV